jgi:hypothetical protein
MCLAPDIRPEGPAPKGQESLAQGTPWAMLSWPLRATEWKRPNTFCWCDGKHTSRFTCYLGDRTRQSISHNYP